MRLIRWAIGVLAILYIGNKLLLILENRAHREVFRRIRDEHFGHVHYAGN